MDLVNQVVTTYRGLEITGVMLKDMKDWINDCCWANLELGEVYSLTNVEVLNGVQNHFHGGVEAFISEYISSGILP